MVRISIDAINLLVIDEQFAFNIAISSLQFAFCNCHEASFTSNLNVNSSLVCDLEKVDRIMDCFYSYKLKY